jgi:hypothetical protein
LVPATGRAEPGAVLAADVEDPLTGVVVQMQQLGPTDEAVPAERQEDYRELQALAAVHGQDLHRVGVGF